MGFISRLFDWGATMPTPTPAASDDGAVVTLEDLAVSMRAGGGVAVTPESAMRVATVYACVRIISGAVANLPLSVMRRADDRRREEAGDLAVSAVLRRRPNGWQTPSQFRRMMQAHVLLRGNAYALIVRSRGQVVGLLPLQPERMEVRQADDLRLTYRYSRRDGGRVDLAAADVLHLVGLTLDGVHGLSPIAYARESIGLSLAMEGHGSTLFRNGARPSAALRHPSHVTQEAAVRLRESMDAFRVGGEREGKTLILEEGMDYQPITMSAEDTQWIESRKFSRTDIAMFFGVPPHMIGDTEKSTSWGTGIEQQSIGFVSFTLEDHLTMWEERIALSLLGEDPRLYARFNRAALVRGDIKSRWEAHVKSLQWGVHSPNEIRALEDENPRDGGDIYYPPPNMAATEPSERKSGD